MFNRVKTIGLTLVGLLAMLGTQAEAHYMYVNGQWVAHSVGCKITELDSVGTAPWAAACEVVPTQVETRCQTLSGTVYTVSSSISGVSLVASPLLNLKGLPTEQNPVEVIVADSPLLDPIVNTACGLFATPTAVLIRNMASTISLFKCAGLLGNPCSVLLPTGTAAAQCTLSTDYDLDNPPNGAAFTCTEPVKVHLLH